MSYTFSVRRMAAQAGLVLLVLIQAAALEAHKAPQRAYSQSQVSFAPVPTQAPLRAVYAPPVATSVPIRVSFPTLQPDRGLADRPPTAVPSPAPTSVVDLAAQERWARIVTGESGGGWLDGSRLVAWTLRAWELHRGMPADRAGPDWGWYGWSDYSTAEARQVVAEVWNQPLSAAPFAFMQGGSFCMALGSAYDARWWKQIGWYTVSDFALVHPAYPNFEMHCYFRPAGT